MESHGSAAYNVHAAGKINYAPTNSLGNNERMALSKATPSPWQRHAPLMGDHTLTKFGTAGALCSAETSIPMWPSHGKMRPLGISQLRGSGTCLKHTVEAVYSLCDPRKRKLHETSAEQCRTAIHQGKFHSALQCNIYGPTWPP